MADGMFLSGDQGPTGRQTFDEDGEINTLLEGGGGSGGNPNNSFEIVRCCTAPNEPWVKLKCKGCHIILPMPSELKSSENPSWEGQGLGKLGTLTNVAEQAWTHLNDMLETSGGDKQAVMDSLTAEAKRAFESAGGLKGIAKAGIAGDFQGIAAKAGVAVLPPKELRFQGISFRNFSFDWKLVPMDQNQSQQIEKAIYKLQYYSLPGASHGVVAYPELWDISFGPGDPHHVMYVKTCACTNITVNYSGAGRTVFHTQDLWPIVVNLSLSFTEQTLHSREDVQKGIYG